MYLQGNICNFAIIKKKKVGDLVYDYRIIKLFSQNKPLEILEEKLNYYNNEKDDAEYHFLLGICLSKLGYLFEAKNAFEQAIKIKPSVKNYLFLIMVLLHAGKYETATRFAKKISHKKMTISEQSMFIEIANRLKLDSREILKKTKKKATDKLDDKILLTFALIFSKKYDEAKSIISTINVSDFRNVKDYFLFWQELYKTKIDQELINGCFYKVWLETLSENDIEDYLKTLRGTQCIFTISHVNLTKVFTAIENKFADNINIQGRLLGIKYEIAEHNKDQVAMEKLAYWANKNKFKNNEQALIIAITNSFKNFQSADKSIMKNQLETLITIDQSNMLYRKWYFEFLVQLGYMNESQVVNKSAIDYKKHQEAKEFAIIQKIRDIYGYQDCPLPKPKDMSCQLCGDSNKIPIIRTIAFNSSPREIYADKIEKHSFQVSDEQLAQIIEWQPMNIASPLIGEYFSKLGAYPSQREFPDVLVKGQTYLFVRMTKEAFNRLAKEGYSLDQIDPLINIMAQYQKMNINLEFSQEPKPIKNISKVLSADDFVIELYKAI